MKTDILEALFRIDELAQSSPVVLRNDNAEAQQLADDYRLVSEYIKADLDKCHNCGDRFPTLITFRDTSGHGKDLDLCHACANQE